MATVAIRYAEGGHTTEERVRARTNGAKDASCLSKAVIGRVVQKTFAGMTPPLPKVVDVFLVDDRVRRRDWSLPEPPEYTVAIDWKDGFVEDTSEITVTAASPAGAVSKAKAVWRRTEGRQYPSCRMCGAWLMTPKRMDMIAS